MTMTIALLAKVLVTQKTLNKRGKKRWRSEDNAIGYRVRDQGEKRARLDNRHTKLKRRKKERKNGPGLRLVKNKKNVHVLVV